jgi:hypothetical protein
MNSYFGRVLIAGCFIIWTGDAQANLITNGSFENTNNTFVGDGNKTMSLASGSTAIPGWTTTNGTFTAWIQNGNPWNIPASDGSFFLDLTAYADSVTYGGVTQSFATTVGTNYVLTFDLGYGGNSGAFGGPASVNVSVGGAPTTFTSGSGTPNPAVWNHETFNFTATSTTTVLSIIGHSTAGGQYIGLDNADVELGTVSGVPESATFGFVGVALIGLSTLRLRQRWKR